MRKNILIGQGVKDIMNKEKIIIEHEKEHQNKLQQLVDDIMEAINRFAENDIRPVEIIGTLEGIKNSILMLHTNKEKIGLAFKD